MTDWLLQKLSKKHKLGPGLLWGQCSAENFLLKTLWTESCSLGGTGWFCRHWNVCEAYGGSPDLPSLLVFSWVKRRPTTNSTEHPCPVDAVVRQILLHATGVIMNPLSYFIALWDYHWSILVRLEIVTSKNDFYGICLISWIVGTGHCSWEIIFNA